MQSQRTHLYIRLQQSQNRVKSLQKINSQLARLIQFTQAAQYKQLLHRLSQQQRTSSIAINQLKIKISHLQTQLSFQQNHHQTIISDFTFKIESQSALISKLKSSLSNLNIQNNNLKRQLQHHRIMIKNQQSLIDEYKKSMEQQKQIEKQINKCQAKQFYLKLKNEMQRKVEQIRKQYEKKYKKIVQRRLQNDYEQQMKNLKRYLTEKKRANQQNKKNGSCLKDILVKDYDQSYIEEKVDKMNKIISKKIQKQSNLANQFSELSFGQALILRDNKTNSLGSTLEQDSLVNKFKDKQQIQQSKQNKGVENDFKLNSKYKLKNNKQNRVNQFNQQINPVPTLKQTQAFNIQRNQRVPFGQIVVHSNHNGIINSFPKQKVIANSNKLGRNQQKYTTQKVNNQNYNKNVSNFHSNADLNNSLKIQSHSFSNIKYFQKQNPVQSNYIIDEFKQDQFLE